MSRSKQSRLREAERLLVCRDERALHAFHLAEQCGANPDRCAAGRWMAHILAGDFAAAWHESDTIRRRDAPDPHRLWDGEPFQGRRVILRCLHGLGDAIQFLRYAPRLRSITSDLVIEVAPRLVEFARHIDGVDRVITWGEYAPREPVQWDSQIEIMELPYIFRTEMHELPIAENYIRLPHSEREVIARLMGQTALPRIGLVWAAGDWNPSRSIPFRFIETLTSVSDCEFWNLQGGAAHRLWERLPSSPRLRDAAECGEGVMNLACVIAELDLVITVDTLAAHLAGAMGIPAWVLLQHSADWRWLLTGATSPWYPSLRLFRQRSPGDWRGLIAEVRKELSQWTQLHLYSQKIA